MRKLPVTDYLTAAWLLASLTAGAMIWLVFYDFSRTNWLALPPSLGFVIFCAIAGRPFKKPSTATGLSLKRTGALLTAGLILVSGAFLPRVRSLIVADLPRNLGSVIAYDPVVSTRVFSADGELICDFATQKRVRIPLEKVPKQVRDAFIAAEDQRFYSHRGIDPQAIVRAAAANWRSQRTKQGGSTLTQQVVKQVILRTNEKSISRKIREALLAIELEKRVSKDKILEVYLNHIYLGHGAYGVETAAAAYFGKSVGELTLAESAMLAGLPKAPSADSPVNRFGYAKQRQTYVLGRMAALEFIGRQQMNEAMAEPVAVIEREEPLNASAAPWFCEHARRELKRLFGEDFIFNRGGTVVSTIDMKMQRSAEAAVRLGLIDLERKLGFSGPIGHDDSGNADCEPTGEYVPDGTVEIGRVVSAGKEMAVCVRGSEFLISPDDRSRIRAWEHRKEPLRPGDIIPVRVVTFEKKFKKQVVSLRHAIAAGRSSGADSKDALQAALIAVDVRTGELKALVGGYDWNENQFNNATQARRQIGSSVKPYIYLTGLMSGLNADEKLKDEPRCYSTASGKWCPKNYLGPRTERQYMGLVDLRTALAKSLNSVSVQIAANFGVREVIKTMRALGITSPVTPVLPIAVGAVELTLWEHTYAYAALAALGKELPRHQNAKAPGIFFTEVRDEKDNVLMKNTPSSPEYWPQAAPSADVYALIHLMRGVVEFGTGRRVRELGRPAAGKTGTTNDFRDAWFMGFTADLAAGVWVGRVSPQPISADKKKEATGGVVALPIWLSFMKAAHPPTPPREFPAPSDIALVRDETGALTPYARGRIPDRLLVKEEELK